jgi:anti-sigma B factor antagonist
MLIEACAQKAGHSAFRHPETDHSAGARMMKLSVENPRPNVRRIVLDGRMDMAGIQAIETEFNAAMEAGPNVIVDLGKVPFLASIGVRLLVSGAKTQAALGGRMVLLNPDDLTRRILKTTGINQLMPVHDGLDAALAVFD